MFTFKKRKLKTARWSADLDLLALLVGEVAEDGEDGEAADEADPCIDQRDNDGVPEQRTLELVVAAEGDQGPEPDPNRVEHLPDISEND